LKFENPMSTNEAAKSKSGEDAKPPKSGDSSRETIESVVVAFILAFLFRTFEAEAFVIPTGSMAPTLYGQHREVDCARCGTRFATGGQIESEVHENKIVHSSRTQYAICPNANCRFANDVLDREVFAGDRILVTKFPYEFHSPDRWDVVVFKYPEQSKTNYIKRLVALPGEEVKISGGDIWTRPQGDSGKGLFIIARKPPEKQRQLQLLVHDNDRPAQQLLETGWPESWQPRKPRGASWDVDEASGWVADPKARSFRFDQVAGREDEADSWIRYAHYIPAHTDWERAAQNAPPASPPTAQLIKDFYAYNARVSVSGRDEFVRHNSIPIGEYYWVGDLTLSCTVEVLGSGGQIVFELVEGKRRYQCLVHLGTGEGQFQYQPELSEDGKWEAAGEAFDSGMNSERRFDVVFANVDDRLCFWVNDRLVKQLEFNPGGKYPPLISTVSTQADYSPVGISASGVSVRVSHLKIERDVYYTPSPGQNYSADHDITFKLRDDPDNADNDEFLMLGDNSPHSNDSRAWLTQQTVPRRLLTGKAFFVYWPHAVPFLNDGRGYAVSSYQEGSGGGGRDRTRAPIPAFTMPFYPNVGRMHRIR
jgi:signal peptidase I